MGRASLARGFRAAAMAGLVAAAGCSPIVRTHGYVPAPDQLAEVEVGQDTRDTVAEKIGQPMTRGMRDDRAWYYVASERETFGPAKPRTTRRDIVAVRFTEDGQVENIERFDVNDGRVVVLTARVTDPSVSEMGILQQIFGNVGGPTAEDFLGGGGGGGDDGI
ncbi:outer membrane protein assembly factor BamE [Meridianimarinicoccus sp. RP-17]|uniref:outer membrane protein assembly factor BamE n=1 Tax=Meridianimarinicoccus zhengii TaxID=2056810 RepID=UPI0013A6C3C3|nr:outer membrane protein assembly factor BamE [Phycocomes zhengii]